MDEEEEEEEEQKSELAGEAQGLGGGDPSNCVEEYRRRLIENNFELMNGNTI